MAKRKPTSTTPATTPAASKTPRTKYRPEMCDTIIALGKKGQVEGANGCAPRHQPLDL